MARGKFWIAVNDRTVARVKNKSYAVIRAKAGRITLNLAAAGMVWASIALDDRPGETVYLKWTVGDTNISEVSKSEGMAFIAKRKRTKDIESPLPNNEEISVLANLPRLGFHLMRWAQQKPVPDAEHGVIRIFRRYDGQNLEFGVWDEEGLVGALNTTEGFRLRVPAGVHYLMAASRNTALLKAEVQAGKEYFAWLDWGQNNNSVRLAPIPTKAVTKLKKWLVDVNWIELKPGAKTPRVQEREDIVTTFMRSEVADVESGNSDSYSIGGNFYVLGSEHAFDSKTLKAHGIE